MEPNFQDHEYLVIDELSYRFRDPARGDIVVFRYPNDPSQYYIKRVIGLPGERVRVTDNAVWVFNASHPNGIKLDETSYLDASVPTNCDRQGINCDKGIVLGAGDYFLMGDNRENSSDSRLFGPVASDFIVGRVWVRGWPPEKFRVFAEHLVSYNAR
jgi:signal peptidase I